MTRASATVRFQTRTILAVCVHAEGSDEDIWLPLSQVDLDPPDPLMRGEEVTLHADARVLKQKGLI